MPDCPVTASHNLGPSGYLAWHEWAEEMAKTHTQKRCPGCKLWVIWEEKE